MGFDSGIMETKEKRRGKGRERVALYKGKERRRRLRGKEIDMPSTLLRTVKEAVTSLFHHGT